VSASDPTLLFVYGTLKRGCSNHPFLAGQRFVGDARTVRGYRLYNLGEFPGMIRLPEDRNGVAGEVWSVTPAALTYIDHLEGLDLGLYRREPVELAPPFAHETVETYIYALSTEGREALDGVWTE
jgi:gamma-glutamylcyclotransferase (GGCT)/AIG2-like uncharacterized protein YtfP